MRKSNFNRRFLRILVSCILVLFVICLSFGCADTTGSDDSGDADYAVTAEKRRTSGCDGYGWEAWKSVCYEFNSGDYNISPEEVKNNLTKSELYCASGCCIDFEFRNIVMTEGTCY